MIHIELTKDYFEYDIRGLVMAFFPQEEISLTKPGQEGKKKQQKKECSNVEDSKKFGNNHKENQLLNKNNETNHLEDNELETNTLFIDYKEKEVVITYSGITVAKDVDYENTKEAKIILKKALYDVLQKATKKELPWGTLTGIRPTKIPMALLEDGKSEEEITSYMKETYYCSHRKIKMSLEIVKREQELLQKIDYKNGYSLYIGIPFCPTTCVYCSFTSYPIGKWEKRMEEYLQALLKEIEFTANYFKDKKLNTIYFGGGTPTTLSPEHLDVLLNKVFTSFDLSHLQEFTVEAGRPDSVTKEKLEVLKKYGVDRISINPQTMKEETLTLIGRRHTVEDVKRVYQMARELGFDNINMDLIVGLPNETLEDVTNTMKEIFKLKPDNLTIHSLAIKRAARLNMYKEKYGELKLENSDETMNVTEEYARKMGLTPYYLYRQKNMSGNMENVGYAAEGKAGLYNILIMEEKQTIVALGAGSSTKAVFEDRIERAENVKDVETYIANIDEMIERKKRLFGFK